MRWFNNIVSYFAEGKTADQLQAESDAADAQRAEMNRQEAERYRQEVGDVFANEWYAQTLQNDSRAQQNVHAEIDAGFQEGWQEGKDNVTTAVAAPFRAAGDGLGAVVKGVLVGVPLWIWAVLAFAAFVYFGGLGKLRKATA